MSRKSLSPISIIVVLPALVAAGCAQLADLPQLTKADLRRPQLAESSRIYDGNDDLVTSLHGVENRTVISLKKIPKSMQDAVVAIEDERFYEHDGVDFKAIIRAAFANAASGEISEGGSTITQQYVKNVIIAPGGTAEKTLSRKIDEAALARQLETKLSKKKILARYMNTVYFGNGAYGVQAAARTYFHKAARKLTLAESALLAGIIRSPDTYDPYDQKETALQRRNTVIDKMVELGWVSAADASKARGKGLGVKRIKDDTRYGSPYFVDYVKRLIKYDPRFEDIGIGDTPNEREQSLFQGGLRIYTTVDPTTQTAAEDAVTSYLGGDTPYGSMVAIDPETGYVKAMVGGRGFFANEKEDPFAKLNLAIQAEPGLGRVKDCGAEEYEPRAPGCGRQAGSAYKPFALAAALEEGIPLSKTYRAQECMEFPIYDWRPCNYEESEFGDVTLMEATAQSINVVYAQVALEVGPELVVEEADEMGITTPQDPYASAVLGTNPVNPLNMASAYGTLAANGVHHPATAIRRIENASGDILYDAQRKPAAEYPECTSPEGREASADYQPCRALPPAVAYLATTALQGVVSSGTGTNAGLPDGRDQAGKTGTAQEYRDAWFVGYTPELVASVWVGHPEGQISMATDYGGGPVFGGSWPAQIWSNFFGRLLGTLPPTPFDVPETDLITVTVDTRGENCLASETTPDEYRDTVEVLPGTEPDETCQIEGDIVEVPDVIDFPAADAVAAMHGVGLDVSLTYETTDDYPPGLVMSQSPEGGSQAEEGSTVTLTISIREEADGTVPGVLGMAQSNAESALFGAGYSVETVTQAESSPGQAKKNSGLVWKQDPSSGTSLSEGSTVTIWVNP
jgi:penicillin-binding protein 1A